MILVEQCEHCGANIFIAHSKLSNVCLLPAIVIWKALSYSFPQFSHLFICSPFLKFQVLNFLKVDQLDPILYSCRNNRLKSHTANNAETGFALQNLRMHWTGVLNAISCCRKPYRKLMHKLFLLNFHN